MAAARIAATAVRFFALADETAPPETLDVVRRQRQLLRRAAALCLEPIAEEKDDSPFISSAGAAGSRPRKSAPLSRVSSSSSYESLLGLER